ncbi:hypothetical protein Rhal01_01479 [Rubritalea halochordaticola]|uniref:PA14 domain-containing protein n=1 Tax=Rubritalea halochordaticola TaxID=714537 RepID=A0ABP9V127_9BACT
MKVLTLIVSTILTCSAAPNIIFILTDDLGYGDLGVLFQNNKAGTKKMSTPELDAMAGEGMILNRHYTPAPVCAPARASLLLGVHQGHSNVRDNQFDKALEDNHTLASTLQAAGYYTAIIGKYGLQGSGSNPTGWPAYPTKRGFDYFYGYVRHGDGHTHYPDHVTASRGTKEVWENNNEISDDLDKCYTTDLFTARAKKLIIDETNNNPNRPFFLYLAYDTPHAALQLPTVAYPSGKGLTGGLQWNGTAGSMINTATGTIDSYRNPLYTGNGWSDGDERFATMVTRIDDCVGDLVQTLKDLNIDDNTIIVFTSDNGPHSESYISGIGHNPTAFQSYGPFEGEKRDTHEGGIRMPTLAWGPTRVQANTITNQLSQFHDWLPTFCDFAGIDAPARSDGVSLVPTLTGSGSQREPITYVEYSVGGNTPNYYTNHGGTSRNQSQVIYLDGYKGIRNNVTSHSQDFRIYDTLSDEPEAVNLAGSSTYFTTLQQRMKDRVLQIRQPNSSASRAYDSELVPAINTATESGIEVSKFEGSWTWVPEFQAMTPLSTVDTTTISTSHLTTNTDAGLLYTGYIDIPEDGTWTFYTTSDEGTILRIHDSLVIDDDFNHSGSEASGTIQLKAGLHPFRLYYRTAADTPALSLSWSGPSTAKAIIPDSELYRATPPSPIPAPENDQAQTQGTQSVSIPVLANDLDDGAPSALSIASVGQPPFGSAVINGSNIDFTANAGAYGQHVFDYTVTDGENEVTATVTVDVIVPSTDLWFPLNETEGSLVYEAGGAYAGALSGFTDLNAAHILGKHGYALDFDGDDDQVNLSGLTLPSGKAARTITAWLKVPDGTAPENQTFFAYGPNSSGQRVTCRLHPSGSDQTLRLEVQGGYIYGSTKINDGQWHHVAIVIDDFNTDSTLNVNEAKLYVDGVLETNLSSSGQSMNTTVDGSAVIGAASHATNYNFLGAIDEVHIYNSAFDATAVNNHFQLTNQARAAWAYRNTGSTSPDFSSDGDGDGINLLQEYAFGANPLYKDARSTLPSIVINPSTNKAEIVYTRRTPGTHSLSYQVLVSDDLSTWLLPSTETQAISHPLLGSGFQQVTTESDSTTLQKPKLFFKVEASE